MVRMAVKLHSTAHDGSTLLLRRKGQPFRGRWDLPGGAVEESEAPEEALRRELAEELGVTLARCRYVGAHWLDTAELGRTLSLVYQGDVLGRPVNREPTVSHGPEFRHLARVSPGQLSPSAGFALEQSGPMRAQPTANYSQGAPVLLLAPFFPLGDREAMSIPLGLAYIHAALAAREMDADVLDCSIVADYDKFINIRSWRAQVVGVQFHSTLGWDFCLRACFRLRREAPAAVIVAGGELAHARKDYLLGERVVDYVVSQEGEIAFAEFATAVLAGCEPSAVPGVISMDGRGRQLGRPHTRVDELDSLPLPSISAFRWSEYGQWTMMTSRGCPFRCTYCSSAAFWDHSVRYHSAEWIVAEMRRLRDYGAEDVYIADDTFTLNRRRTGLLCDALVAERVLNWSCLTRVDCVDEALLHRMAAAGCKQISFGFETANDQSLVAVSKRATYGRAAETVRSCRAAGIRTRVSVIIGLPGEVEDDVRATILAVESLMPNEVQLYALTPHDGTALFHDLDRVGVRIIEPDTALWTRDVRRPVCETDTMSGPVIASMGLEFMARLERRGYVNLSQMTGQRKISAEYTVGTAFTPVQGVRSIT